MASHRRQWTHESIYIELLKATPLRQMQSLGYSPRVRTVTTPGLHTVQRKNRGLKKHTHGINTSPLTTKVLSL